MVKEVRTNFLEECVQASGLEQDKRFRSWVKWVDAVDPEKQNGYAFQGDFIKEGTVEIETGAPRVILVSVASGSRKYTTRHYGVLVLEADGTLRRTDIFTTDATPGWALRVRDRISQLIANFAGRPPEDKAGLVTTLEVINYLKVEDLMPLADIRITDWDDVRKQYEVAHKGERQWMEAAEAAAFIAERLNRITLIGGDDD